MDIDSASSEQSIAITNSWNSLTFSESENQISRQIPELSSAKFQFSLWHDLKNSEIKGNQLKAPRIRIGPNEKDKPLYFGDDCDTDIESDHHELTGKEKTKHRDALESWEKAELASFGYQELQNGYQKKNLYRILAKLKSVKHLNLAHNQITNINSYSFPHCEYLNLNNNFIASFKCLPKVSKICYITLKDNDIMELDGLKALRSTSIEELYLNGNPVTFTAGYRQRVFSVLPNLKVLDGIYQLTTDTEPVEAMEAPKSCLIS
ncbi:protein tilB homolog [Patella vulgata]|uniref:protein tilB homolog n=1 Tax=Patella vulgata TaxID=6465 RepID=UPI00217FBD16|nr:protein tilB homolog [Patella vulgata]